MLGLTSLRRKVPLGILRGLICPLSNVLYTRVIKWVRDSFKVAWNLVPYRITEEFFPGSGFAENGIDNSSFSESWCFGLPAEGEPSISFSVSINRTISNFNEEGHTSKQIVQVTILNCTVGHAQDSLI